ncbi:DUF2807 domain-containing protein [Olivibacter sp. SDN3]|uniref:head GIN domain-containing protein n=1 Tax=Olivibacter sp. SDN3 TaxID=2764720 RepID=UPI0016515CA5|nr:head GIN domain-containing protein [Olivibacter sp. SDN3]QNL51475.1 DUF2807 domain-containing protein [Olivibacter sp. SDN3]
MKRLLYSLGWLAALVPFLCIGIAHAAITNKSADETRQVSGFHAIENIGSIDLEITLGSSESLKIIGNQEAIDLVETEVKNGVLVISIKKNNKNLFNNWRVQKNLLIQISAKSLDALTQRGSGDIVVKNQIQGDQLQVALIGSGDIELPVNVKKLSASIVGSGDIDIKGTAESADITIQGSGDFDGSALKTRDSNAKVSGSGDISIYVSNTLNAHLSGSGDISYSGNPKEVNKQKSGSGDISGR